MRSPAEVAGGGTGAAAGADSGAGAPSGGRVGAERALRAAALAALGVALWQRLAPPAPPAPAAAARADGPGLAAALARWTAVAPRAVDVRLDTLPGPEARAWLAALAAAGTPVTWGAAQAPALAATAEPAADPAGGLRLLAAAPAGVSVAVTDVLGPLGGPDASGAAGAGARGAPAVGAARARTTGNVSAPAGIVLALPDAAGMLRVGAGGATARLRPLAPPRRLGTVLVVGHASWEGRFAAAALEERGWTVRTRFAVAPGVVVGDVSRVAARPAAGQIAGGGMPAAAAAGSAPAGSAAGSAAEGGAAAPPPSRTPARPDIGRLDTAGVAAVVALDSTAAPLAPALARYVRAGGGLVLAGDAARAPALAALAPAASGPASDDSTGAVAPLVRLRADAVPLAYREVAGARTLVAAARRVGAGRVVQLADLESWRQRLRADDAAPAAHRAWWAQAVAAAAYAPSADTVASPAAPTHAPVDSLPDPAPLAATVAALGSAADPPAPDQAARAPGPRRRVPDPVLVALALAALLAEVASRRLRGAA
jgi:hypothetical protein